MNSALKGVKVVDMSRVLAGPFSTMLLGDFGADVIKVELPGGSDETRGWGPPYKNGESAYYLCTNRNKRAITVDVKTEEGRGIIHQLIKDADVFIENFRVGKANKLGIGYEELRKINPGIIYCSITGFGQTGPYKDYPGYDYIVQAMGGLMSITGDESGPPFKVGVAVTDLITGLFLTTGILSALRVKEKTGQGQYIDISLLDSQVAALANVASNYLIGGVIPKRYGNQHPNIVPYQTFPTNDGEIVVAVGNDQQFKRLCDLLNIENIAKDDRFRTNKDRLNNREELITILNQSFSIKTGNEWLELLGKHEIPCSPINTIDQVFHNPQVKARNMVVSLQHPIAGDISLVNNPIKLSETPTTVRYHPPMVGEHTKEILLGIGYSEEKLEELANKGVIGKEALILKN